MTQFWTNDLISRTVQNCEDCGIRMVFEALHASYSFGIIYANEQNQSRSFFCQISHRFIFWWLLLFCMRINCSASYWVCVCADDVVSDNNEINIIMSMSNGRIHSFSVYFIFIGQKANAAAANKVRTLVTWTLLSTKVYTHVRSLGIHCCCPLHRIYLVFSFYGK